MYCKYCGTELSKDGVCPRCGIAFETESHIAYEDSKTTYTEKKQGTPKTSGMAVAGFVLAILYFFASGKISDILGLLSFVFSLVGMSHAKNGVMRGRGFAIAGLIICLTPFVLGFLYGFVTTVR